MKPSLVLGLLIALLCGSTLAGTNPTRAEVFEHMKTVGREYQIPPEILMGVADQESGLRQYHDDGTPVVSGDDGIGMMQVTPWAVAQAFDRNSLMYDWKYNVRAGAIVLLSKWQFVTQNGNIIGNGSPLVLENWYLALWAYNGYSYQNNPNLYVSGAKQFCNAYLCWTRYRAYQDEVLSKIQVLQGIRVSPIPLSALPTSGIPADGQAFATPQPSHLSVIARQPSPSAALWTQIVGEAQDIAISRQGQIWVTGQNQHVYRFVSGTQWAELDGRAVRIGIDQNDQPWVVNAAGQIYQRASAGWKQVAGEAMDISVGGGSVWVIGANQAIYQLISGDRWARVDGAATRIAVGPDGSPWVVNSAGRIYRRLGNTWQELPGGASDIAIGANGTAWVIGLNGKPHRWNGSTWNVVEAQAKSLSVLPDGRACIIDANNEIFCLK